MGELETDKLSTEATRRSFMTFGQRSLRKRRRQRKRWTIPLLEWLAQVTDRAGEEHFGESRSRETTVIEEPLS